MQYMLLILQFLKIIAWPALILTVFLYLKKNIKNLIDKIIELNVFGVRAKFNAEEENKKNLQKDTPDEIQRNGKDVLANSDLVKEKKEEIENKLPAEDQTSKIKILENELAIKDLTLQFERIFNRLFLAQWGLLELIKHEGGSIIYPAVENYFKQVAQQNSGFANWGIENFLSFLIKMGLIERIPLVLTLTDKGQTFLNYIAQMGYVKFGV